jgi:hypothetical protein
MAETSTSRIPMARMVSTRLSARTMLTEEVPTAPRRNCFSTVIRAFSGIVSSVASVAW